MLFHARPTRTTQNLQPTAIVFAEFTADHPHLHLDSVQMSVGTVTVHLHGPHALEHLAHWEEALGNCARSNDSFPGSYGSRLHYTERRTAVVAGTAFEAVAFHDGPGTYDPHGMIWPSNQEPVGGQVDIVPARQTAPARRCALALSVATALAVTAVTGVTISRRVNSLRPLRARG